jgi:1,3-beta-glucan synthase
MLGDFGATQYGSGREPYPAWGVERTVSLSKEEIEDIFLDPMQNMVRYQH